MTHFQRLLVCRFENALTIDLLLFGQSMCVLIAKRIKYLILMKGKIYLIENQDNTLLGLFVFFLK